MKNAIKELEEKLNKICETHENDCSKCPLYDECEKYKELYEESSGYKKYDYHYDLDGNEYWIDENGKKHYTREEG